MESVKPFRKADIAALPSLDAYISLCYPCNSLLIVFCTMMSENASNGPASVGSDALQNEEQEQPRDESPMDKTEERTGAEEDSRDRVEESEALQSAPVDAASVASDAFSQLVKGWENYVNSHKAKPLQMLQGLHFGGPPRGSSGPVPPLAPAPLRHTHSTPLKRTTRSIYEEQDDDDVPPPIPLDPFQRASSTPHSFRQRSINSAFSVLDKSDASVYTDAGSIHSAFGPIVYYANALEDMERTSIEVTDTQILDEAETSTASPKQRRGAGSRAARFLSDVKVLPRRKRKGGKSNRSAQEERQRGIAVSVITEPDYTPREVSMLTQTTEPDVDNIRVEEDEVKPQMKVEEKPAGTVKAMDPVAEGTEPSDESEPESSGKEEPATPPSRYQSLDSDVDEEQVMYQKIETTLHSDSSLTTVPSPSYQQIVDTPSPRPGETEAEKRVIRIKVSNNVSSPSPTTMVGGANDSPGSSAGHTTNATSLSSGPALTTISETDREVMEANKKAKLPRTTSVHSSSTHSSTSTATPGATPSPVLLREGANVIADRFFHRTKRSLDSLSLSQGSSVRSEENEEREDSPSDISLARLSLGRPPRSPGPRSPHARGLTKPYVLRTIQSGELWDDVGDIPLKNAMADETGVEQVLERSPTPTPTNVI